MSRIGRKPIPVPQGVRIAVEGQEVKVEGPRGKLAHSVPKVLTVAVENGQLQVERTIDHRSARALHGLTRSLLANMVQGVSQGFERKLEIVGIGYRAQLQGRNLQLILGYSHPVVFPIPEGIQAEVERQVVVTLRGADKALLGQTAARLRSLREPDPYKGKGIKYAEEIIRRKVGKKAGAAATK
ncbi:MAG: 50S ribosomal protein L6 [Candidatus Rokubacteria bacterium]|nr:50S ribosomal protein L6 [Candidatus Rokubacteria bacterium]